MSAPPPIQTAARLPGEREFLTAVVGDMADHSPKRAYAAWLSEQNDARGPFLTSLLDAWHDGSGPLPSGDEFDEVWRNVSGVTLLQQIRAGQLDRIADAICSAARPALRLTPHGVDDDLPIGATKFGGQPDLARGTAWPEYDNKLHTFIGQFDLAALSGSVVTDELPSAGLLSFFVFDDPIETGQPAAEGAPGAWAVVYTPDTSQLERVEPPQAFDEGNRLAPEFALRMEETLDLPYVSTWNLDADPGYADLGRDRALALGLTNDDGDGYEAILEALLPEREESSHLLGWSHPQVLADDPVEADKRHLLTVASEEALEWCWADGHQLYYSISEADLAAGGFHRTDITDG